jgi:hypothetical protein
MVTLLEELRKMNLANSGAIAGLRAELKSENKT